MTGAGGESETRLRGRVIALIWEGGGVDDEGETWGMGVVCSICTKQVDVIGGGHDGRMGEEEL